MVATFENRRGLKKVFEMLRAGEADTVIVAWKDCLTRFGFEHLKNHAEDLGVRIEGVNEREERTPHEELVGDLLSVVASFSGRLYGMGSNKARMVVESVKRAVR